MGRNKGEKHEKLNLDYGVVQMKFNGEVVAEYDSIRDASLATGVRYSQIYACVTGRSKKSAGYLWQKIESADDEKS